MLFICNFTPKYHKSFSVNWNEHISLYKFTKGMDTSSCNLAKDWFLTICIDMKVSAYNIVDVSGTYSTCNMGNLVYFW